MAYDTDITLLKIATTAPGPGATVSDLTGVSWDFGADGTTRRYVFGSNTAYVKSGRSTSRYTLDGLLDMADTGGQNVLENAYNDKSDVYVSFLPDPNAATGERTGWQEKCKVTAYSGNSQREGDFVECSFTLEGDGTRTDVVAA